MRAEHFIPLRKAELAASLANTTELAEADQVSIQRLFERLSFVLHSEFHSRLESLKNLYTAYDPDLETADLLKNRQPASKESLRKLFDQFDELAERANFRALTLADLNHALDNRTEWGLNLEIDIQSFDQLEIYARGNMLGKRQRRNWRNFFRIEDVEVPIYERLIIVFQLNQKRKIFKYADGKSVFLKLFKDIPQHDIDMLLPATQVRMTLLDRARILIPTASGIGIVIWKIFRGLLVAAFVGFYGIFTLLGLLGGTIGYGLRSFFGYLNTKNKYQLSLTESLYYQNLDNNAGVFFRLLDEAEEQENCEAMLAYFFLWQQAPAEGWAASQLDRAVETYLHSISDRPIDFEVHDALRKLDRFGLSIQIDNRYQVLPPDAALERLNTLNLADLPASTSLRTRAGIH